MTRSGPLLAAMVVSMAMLQLFLAAEARSSLAFVTKTPLSSLTQQQQQSSTTIISQLRGGSSSTVEIDMDEIESSDEEEDEDDEEEEAALDPKLAKSAQAASSKVKARVAKAAASATKAAVAASLSKSKPEKKKSSSGGLFSIPYIVKAVLNPFIFMQMTSAYWKSLFNYKFEETLMVRYLQWIGRTLSGTLFSPLSLFAGFVFGSAKFLHFLNVCSDIAAF